MDVFQIRLKLFTKEKIALENVQELLSRFIDSSFFYEEKWKAFHYSNLYKLYCFDQLYPIEKTKQYKAHKVYTLTIRTVRQDLAQYFVRTLPHHETTELKGLVTEIQILPYHPIEKLYSITPVILKTKGYWRNQLSISEYESQMFINLIKKYQQIIGEKMDEDFEWAQMITILNQKPIAVKQKNITLLGDKIEIHVSSNPKAQKLSYFALGVGLGTNNARGAGTVNVKWL